MKRSALTLISMALVAVSTAQVKDLTPTNMSLRLGGGYVLDSTSRDTTGTMYLIGLDFNSGTSFIKGSEPYVSLEYFGKGIKGRSTYILPIMFNQRFVMSQGDDAFARTYFYGGIGAVNVNFGTSKWTFGARAGVGRDFGPHIFAEAGLLITGEVDGLNGNNLGFSIGYRF